MVQEKEGTDCLLIVTLAENEGRLLPTNSSSHLLITNLGFLFCHTATQVRKWKWKKLICIIIRVQRKEGSLDWEKPDKMSELDLEW